MKWTDNLPSDVYSRLCNCRSLKSDLVPLTQAKWNSLKAKSADYTRADALTCILELLDANNQWTLADLTIAETYDILYQVI